MRSELERTLYDPLLTEDVDGFGIPGVVVTLDPDDDAWLVPFEEDALDEGTAWEANLGGEEGDHGDE